MASAAKLVNASPPYTVAQERSISPALRGWIQDCIVPILVQEYLATCKNHVVPDTDKVLEPESNLNSTTIARMGQ